MKANRPVIDIGTIFDEIFDAAREFSGEFQKNFDNFKNSQQKPEGPNNDFEHKGPFWGARDEGVDFYPAYSYPPMNVWMGRDRQMVFEFALAGFSEKNISLSFQGDYMIFSAKSDVQDNDEDRRYFKRRLKFKDIERQKYYVPADKFEQEHVKAVFTNGILRISIPPKDEVEANGGIKIEIVSEDE